MDIRSWSTSVFQTALSETRTPSVQNNLIEEFFDICEDMVATDPGEYGTAKTNVYLHITKFAAVSSAKSFA